jgi:hypothetical protein
MLALEAATCPNHPSGQRIDALPQVLEGVLEKLAFHLASFGCLLSLLYLPSRSVGQALHKPLHVAHWGPGTPGTERALQIGVESKSSVCRSIGGELPLGAGHPRSEPRVT